MAKICKSVALNTGAAPAWLTNRSFQRAKPALGSSGASHAAQRQNGTAAVRLGCLAPSGDRQGRSAQKAGGNRDPSCRSGWRHLSSFAFRDSTETAQPLADAGKGARIFVENSWKKLFAKVFLPEHFHLIAQPRHPALAKRDDLLRDQRPDGCGQSGWHVLLVIATRDQ